MFVEDTDWFILDENIDKLFQEMYKELKSVSTWFKAKRSTINTKWAIFHPTFKACFVPKKFTHWWYDSRTRHSHYVLGRIYWWKYHMKIHITQLLPRFLKAIAILYRATLIVPRKQLSHYFFIFA